MNCDDLKNLLSVSRKLSCLFDVKAVDGSPCERLGQVSIKSTTMSKSGNGWSAWVHGVSDTGPSEAGGTNTDGSSVETRNQTPGPHASSLPPAYGTLPPRPLAGPDVTVLLGPQKVSLVEAYLLWFVLGVTGAHHFYLRRPCFGFVYLLTGGLVGLGWLVDGFRLPWLVEETNQRLRNPQLVKTVTLSDAYVLWFPFGFLGKFSSLFLEGVNVIYGIDSAFLVCCYFIIKYFTVWWIINQPLTQSIFIV